MSKVANLLRIATAGIALSILACAAPVASSTNDVTNMGCTVGAPDPRACDPADTKKTTICHIPPGNPANAHTICVGNAAVPAHLAHGDFVGTCACTSGGVDASGTVDAPLTPLGHCAAASAHCRSAHVNGWLSPVSIL
jgi:hypothetical protein